MELELTKVLDAWQRSIRLNRRPLHHYTLSGAAEILSYDLQVAVPIKDVRAALETIRAFTTCMSLRDLEDTIHGDDIFAAKLSGLLVQHETPDEDITLTIPSQPIHGGERTATIRIVVKAKGKAVVVENGESLWFTRDGWLIVSQIAAGYASPSTFGLSFGDTFMILSLFRSMSQQIAENARFLDEAYGDLAVMTGETKKWVVGE